MSKPVISGYCNKAKNKAHGGAAMTLRHSCKISTLILSAALACTSFGPSVYADPSAVAPAGDAVQQPYYGVLNQDNVYVRSGPSDVFYATAKLNKGAKVSVVAVREPWLKIVPPEGSYCYVARAYVEKRGDGTVGRVTKAELNVRAGSTLNGLKTTVLTSLSEGDDVKIIGEQEEYFKIAPPPGAYLYVMKTFVDPAPSTGTEQPIVASAKTSEPIASAPIPVVVTPPTPVAPVAIATVAPVPAPPVAVAPVAPVAPVSPVPTPVAPVIPAPVGIAPAAPPVTPVIPASAAPVVIAPVVVSVTPTPAATTKPAVASSVAPATQPDVAIAPAATQPVETADEKFSSLESTFLEATGLPIDQQPLDTLLAGYTAIQNDNTLPSSMQRITTMRLATIKLRSDAQKQYLEAKKLDADAQARKLALRAEHDELAQKARDQEVSIYTALGTLRISSLQQSGTTLYRLTDPTSGRTLVYLKSNDPKYSSLLNQFVGVKGDVSEDSNLNLKVIDPTGVDTVDQAKVNNTITATIMPPSLLPKTVSTIGN